MKKEIKPEQIRKKIGKQINDIIAEKGIKIGDLCDKANVTRWHLLNVRKGSTNYTIDTLIKIVYALEIDEIKILK